MPSKTLAPRSTASLLTWMVDSLQGTICPLSQVCFGLGSVMAPPLSKPAHPGAVCAGGREQALLAAGPGREPHLESPRARLHAEPGQRGVDPGRAAGVGEGRPHASPVGRAQVLDENRVE